MTVFITLRDEHIVFTIFIRDTQQLNIYCYVTQWFMQLSNHGSVYVITATYVSTDLLSSVK